MKVSLKYFIHCDECNEAFGGPQAGDYDIAQWPGDTLNEMLFEEALGLFWIAVKCGASEKLFCSKRCAKLWVQSPDCFASAS
jgi:hypothetical protein